MFKLTNIDLKSRYHVRVAGFMFGAPFLHGLLNLVIAAYFQISDTGTVNWKELIELRQYAITAILGWGGLLFYLSYCLSQLRYVPVLVEKIEALTALQGKVRESGIEVVGAVTRLMDRVLGTSLDNRTLSEAHADSYNQSIEALGFKFDCWFEPVRENLKNKRPDMVDTWLRYSRTYNLEEAFDIKRRELATNSRNFTYLILATLDSLADYCKKTNQSTGTTGHKVVHIAVTPVHPKDWFNWPHGLGHGKAYFEEDFISHFWRCLREIKDAPGNKEVMRLERYILSANDPAAQDLALKRLGRRLKTAAKLKESLRSSWLLPVSAPLEEMNSAGVNAPLKETLAGYYRDCIARADYLPTDINVVPFVCRQWVESGAAMRNRLTSLQAADAPSVIGLAEFAERHQRAEIAKHKTQVVNLVSNFPERVKEAWALCVADCDSVLGGKCASLHKFIVNCHKLDVRLCEHSVVDRIYEVQEQLRALVAAMLRLDDCLHRKTDWPDKLPCLGEVFTKWLHYSPQDLKLVTLDAADVQTWHTKGLRNEFHMFGLESPGKPIEWRILVAADINEPFQVAKILLLEEGATARQEAGKTLAGFDDYRALVTMLRNNKGPFTDVTGKVEVAWTP